VSEPTLTPAAFAAKWKGVETTEKASAQSHFIDLCRMLGEPTPHEADPIGSFYAFEKRVAKAGGGDGFADVWKRDFFAWEYKGKYKDLKAAYVQLLNYKDDLGNPPLLVVSDLDKIEIHTNFTSLSPVTRTVTLDDLAAEDPSDALQLLRDIFIAPEALRPKIEPAQITEKAAKHFAEIAQSLRERGHDAEDVAHFLDRILFCLFAEDAGLLPKGILQRLSEAAHGKSAVFTTALGELFAKMGQDGGLFGAEEIQWFNGGLFDSAEVLPLTGAEITILLEVSRLNWAKIEPAIFGTLFERGLDPAQRAQLGAHYTDRDAIWGLVEPVILRPLRREYADMQARVTQLILSGKKVTKATPRDQDPNAVFQAFLDRLRKVRVLDPACGSGNFLIVSLWALKDLEFEAIQWGSLVLARPMQIPEIGPEAVLGIEINAYAAELARVTIWIGEIQWMIRHGLGYRRNPILKPLDHIQNRDALLDLTDPTKPREAEWPAAEFIVGNPPFLGAKLLRRSLGSAYVDALFSVFHDRLPGMSDLSSYFHEKARAEIEGFRTRRAGLLATQSIRGGSNRRVLERILASGGIFFARSDERWVLGGAAVHISFVGQDDGSEPYRELDGRRVKAMNANLTTGTDVTRARRLRENAGIAYIADVKGGPFDITADIARAMLTSPNPDGRPNDDVVRPWMNGQDVTGRPRDMWIIDFGLDMSLDEAALYEGPFEYVRAHVKPFRDGVRRKRYRERWWLHAEAIPGMRRALGRLTRYIATPALAKHRLFVWLPIETLADHQLVVVCRDDDYTFGVLHSKVHRIWALATGTQLETRPRYTPTTTFETFAFPRPSAEQRSRIADASRRLNQLRDGWLHSEVATPELLASRTLTRLYNENPAWLDRAHAWLDEAVLTAYGWSATATDYEILERLLDLNEARRTSNFADSTMGGADAW
jgi:hypothetical protein